MTIGTAKSASYEDDLRARIVADPGLVLDDPQIMRALVKASESAMGGNVVDLRGMAMERQEARLARLEETHRAVIAAAYENMSSTNQVHRAIMALLEPDVFEKFLQVLDQEVTTILRVDCLRMVLESGDAERETGVEQMSGVLRVVEPGFVASYMAHGRSQPPRQIVLRQTLPPTPRLYGARLGDMRSEAVLRLDLGAGRMAGMLTMACADPLVFKPGQGTDLLAFFAGVFERSMRRWLS
ncbi:DUF484 family protein [Roseicitreum antarcticum]|uniref:DUF484 family protein n=1 Tax=Roseicitreum antarcticum TaxID=564137 RepID=A0A1H3ANA7_9RHOB|nr:DUF484 family protein [Roseicitreum antarcticum]SDX31085.1 hypothetical protein SAMN04488238_10766 [Roseicitreum antarcticum]